MSGVFSSVSLLIDVNEEPWKPNAEILWAPAEYEPRRSRVIFHEAVHYWQHLSHSFLVRLVEEEWKRLIIYEKSGEKSAKGPILREFERKERNLDFSARDLHESLARFWDVFVFGPHRLAQIEWDEGKKAVSPDFIKAFHELRREANLPEGSWGGLDFATAMLTLAGQYAVPFNLLNISLKNQFTALNLFPLLGHFAFQTMRPAYFFGKFVGKAGSKLHEQLEEMKNTFNHSPSDLLENTMNELYLKTRLMCDRIVKDDGEQGLVTGLQAFRECNLEGHRAYQWAFTRRILPVVLRLMEESNVKDSARHIIKDDEVAGRLMFAELLLDSAMALVGLPDSRKLLLVGGLLTPPCIRFTNGETCSLPEIYRLETLRELSDIQEMEMLSLLVPFMLQLDAEAEEREIVHACIDIQSRWETFNKALIRSNPVKPNNLGKREKVSTLGMPKWVMNARRFVATDNQEFLSQAAKLCEDTAIREFLSPEYHIYGELDANQAKPVVSTLMSEGRKAEAVMLVILGLKKAALSPLFSEHQGRVRKWLSKKSCIAMASISREHGFTECEALCLFTLGTHHMGWRERRRALKMVRQAVELYRRLAEFEPNLYRHALAASLKSLGAKLLKEKDFSEGWCVLKEAEEIHRDLAKGEPHLYNKMFQFGDIQSPQRKNRDLEMYSVKAKRMIVSAMALLFGGRYTEAVKSIDGHLKIVPNDAIAWYYKGIAQFEARSFDEALRSFDIAIGIDSNDVYAWTAKAITLAETGRHAEAVGNFERAISVEPQDEIPWSEKGKSLAQLERHEEAIKSFEKAISINPRFEMAWYNLGVSLQKTGRYKQALESLDMAIKIDPQDADAWNEKGISLIQLAKSLIGSEDGAAVLKGMKLAEQAIKSWNKALEINPNHIAAEQNKQQFENFDTP